ncbi:MAG: ribonuclease P protein component [Actinomycetota bacterium]|nr:ribonuclease P protein component [Actinomycetota bacterium]
MRRPNRLSRSRDFEAVYRKGRSVSTRYLTLYWFPREEDGEDAPVRLGLAVSRKVGDAVARNRIKRRLRAVLDELEDSLPRARDYVVIVRPGLAEAAESQGFLWLVERVRDVFGRAAESERRARA